MGADSPKLMIEFTDADDRRKKTAWAERVDTDWPMPIPAVGDAISLMFEHPVKLLRVERRLLTYYGDDTVHVQAFCREIEEHEI